MKKLVMVAMLAVGCASAFGANIDWSISRKAWGAQDPYTYTAFEGVSGGPVYAFLSSDLTAVQSILGAATSGAEVDFSSIAVKAGSAFTSSKGAAGGVLSADSLTAGTSYEVFFVAFNKDTLAGSDMYLISNVQSATAYETTAPALGVEAAWGDGAATSGVTTEWKTFAIPEPASGLLLLIGMAGLALRRRRA